MLRNGSMRQAASPSPRVSMDVLMQDAELLHRWRAGDSVAGQQLFQRHFTMLYRFFRRRAPDAAQDLVQTTLLACVEQPGRFRAEATFRTYLYAIARRQLADHVRRRSRRMRWSGPLLDGDRVLSIAGNTSLSSVVRRREQGQRVRDALTQVETDAAAALRLYECEDMTAPEIAEALGVPVGTVRSRIRRARQALRRLLSRRAVTVHH